MTDDIQICDRCGAKMNIDQIEFSQPFVEYYQISFDEGEEIQQGFGDIITLCPACMLDFDSFMRSKGRSPSQAIFSGRP